ncbi:ParB/RepB/Spo0J family partition protein [Hippea alviniae]|uniref:ParB/RepB/Spo0J family partition protein n=1 Tax=Hippea alviniae TaxID=1279027 RepID=UPI0003B3535A|nr:ParB/RepB/Spo0J family partition protein [Hippea alviniae]
MPKKGGLGKGLEAIFGEIENIENEERIINIAIDLIEKNPYQPRETFDDKSIEELTESIKEKGIIQPIIVREKEDKYQIVAGERRFIAAKRAGLTSIPAIVKNFTDKEAAEIALIENIQRKDLNPVEEALAYKRLMENFGYTQEEVARKVGKDRATIANSLRLLKLPEEILNMLKKGEISQGHARAILALKDENSQKELAKKIRDKKLTVREAEREVYQNQQIEELKKLEEKLKNAINTPLKIKIRDGKYSLEIKFDNIDKLNEFIGRL